MVVLSDLVPQKKQFVVCKNGHVVVLWNDWEQVQWVLLDVVASGGLD